MEDSQREAQRIYRSDVVLAVFYGIVILAGIFGNSLVIVVVWKTRTMHTATNYLLVNLAASDILVLLWCPRTYDFAVVGSLPEGTSGDYLCRFFIGDPMDTLCLGVTLFTLTVLAVERYQALVTPLRTKYKLNKKSVIYAISITWIVSLLASIPDFVFTHVDRDSGKCVSPLGYAVDVSGRGKVTYAVIAISLYIFIPFLVITFCYFQILRGMFITHTICAAPANGNSEKRKLAILIIAVTAVFYILFLPFAIFMLLVAFTKHFTEDYRESESKLRVLKVLSFLIVTNSSLNPLLYAFQSENYRNGFRNLFCPNNSVGQTSQLQNVAFRGKTVCDFTERSSTEQEANSVNIRRGISSIPVDLNVSGVNRDESISES